MFFELSGCLRTYLGQSRHYSIFYAPRTHKLFISLLIVYDEMLNNYRYTYLNVLSLYT